MSADCAAECRREFPCPLLASHLNAEGKPMPAQRAVGDGTGSGYLHAGARRDFHHAKCSVILSLTRIFTSEGFKPFAWRFTSSPHDSLVLLSPILLAGKPWATRPSSQLPNTPCSFHIHPCRLIKSDPLPPSCIHSAGSNSNI